MTRLGWIVLGIVVLIILLAGGAWYFISTRTSAPAAVQQATSTPETDLSSSSIYTNGEYGLSLFYPAADVIAETFSPWRTGAVATGTPLISVTDQEGILRIGASNDAKELKACTKAGQAETAQPDTQFGTTTFKVFIRDEVGTDNQTRITSYRALHENNCVAIETIQPLSNGSVTPSPRLDQMLQSFSFARP